MAFTPLMNMNIALPNIPQKTSVNVADSSKATATSANSTALQNAGLSFGTEQNGFDISNMALPDTALGEMLSSPEGSWTSLLTGNNTKSIDDSTLQTGDNFQNSGVSTLQTDHPDFGQLTKKASGKSKDGVAGSLASKEGKDGVAGSLASKEGKDDVAGAIASNGEALKTNPFENGNYNFVAYVDNTSSSNNESSASYGSSSSLGGNSSSYSNGSSSSGSSSCSGGSSSSSSSSGGSSSSSTSV